MNAAKAGAGLRAARAVEAAPLRSVTIATGMKGVPSVSEWRGA